MAGCAFAALFLLAAMQSIPASQYRAAKVDGANAWQCLRFITLPALRKTILILVLVETIWLSSCSTRFTF